MPTLRPDSIFSEFSFTQQELTAARTLSYLQICYLQTRYAQLIKQRASVSLPTDATLDRDFLCSVAELDGQLGIIQDLLDNHQEALKEASDPNRNTGTSEVSAHELGTISARASKLVNQE